MSFQKAALVIDVRNMYTMVGRKFPGQILSYGAAVKALQEKLNVRFVHKVAYIMQSSSKAKHFINFLKTEGFEVHAADVTWNVEIALRCTEIIPSVDALILGSNYNEHGRILRFAREKGKFTYAFGTAFPPGFKNVADLVEIEEALTKAGPKKEKVLDNPRQQLELPSESNSTTPNDFSAEASG